MATGMVHHDQNLEKQIEKQIGCMTGFLHIFDRNQILTGKRLYTTKRLPPCPSSSPVVDSTSSVGSPSISTELEKTQPKLNRAEQCRAPESHSDSAESPVRKHLPLPIFDIKQGSKSSWKLRESPRLSLDSRANVDAKGRMYPMEVRTNASTLSIQGAVGDDSEKQRRSTSVIAKLMGLEEVSCSSPELLTNKSELRRSASESRVPRDLRFMENNTFLQKQNQLNTDSSSNVVRNNARIESNGRHLAVDPVNCIRRSANTESRKLTQRGMNWKSSHFDSADLFPEPKQSVSIYGEIEKRLRMRGIDEPSKDLETLKQILDALQLKGLLHSTKSLEQELSYQNFIYDRNFSHDQSSPIVLMKPSRSEPNQQRRTGMGTTPRRNINISGEGSPAGSPRRDRHDIYRNARNSSRGRNSNSPSRSESSVTSTSSVLRRKSLTVETSRSGNDCVERRTVSSPVHSPKVTFRTASISDHTRSPRNRKPTVEIRSKPTADESSSFSESSTSSHTDTERKEGKSLLERCDKLLNSIAEMNTSELQPSPVSVLDSSFYKDDDISSPSLFLKRSIDFKEAVDLEDELWCPTISPVQSKQGKAFDDSDFLYISDILRASNYHTDNSDIFSLLEKQEYPKAKDASKLYTLERKLTFDIVTEILDRSKQLPPWKTISQTSFGLQTPSLNQIWTEYQKIGERDESKDLFEVIFGVLKKDLAGDAINGWGEYHVETSEAVLDIERMVFKDLIGETIRDLAALAGKSRVVVPRRKLLF